MEGGEEEANVKLVSFNRAHLIRAVATLLFY